MPLKFGTLKEMGIPDHFTCLVRNLSVVQEEPYMEQEIGSKLGNEYIKTILSPCLFNFYAEYIM